MIHEVDGIAMVTRLALILSYRCPSQWPVEVWATHLLLLVYYVHLKRFIDKIIEYELNWFYGWNNEGR